MLCLLKMLCLCHLCPGLLSLVKFTVFHDFRNFCSFNEGLSQTICILPSIFSCQWP